MGTLQPVPKFGETAKPAAAPAAQRSAAWNLQWRKSGQTEPAAAPSQPATASYQAVSQPVSQTTAAASQRSVQAVTAAQPAPRVPVRKLSPLTAPTVEPAIARTSYRQSRPASAVQPAAFQNPGDDSSLQLPPSLQRPDAVDENTDIFNDAQDPFQDDPMQSPLNPLDNPRNNLPPLGAPRPGSDAPGTDGPQLGMPRPATPDGQPSPDSNPMRDPASPYDRGQLPPAPAQPGSPTPNDDPASTPDPDEYINPFQRGDDEAPDAARDTEELPSPRAAIQPSRVQEFSCDAFRDRISARTIEKISLDISPPFRPDILAADDLEKERRKFEEKQEVREWRSMDGYVMARGRLQDMVYEKILVESEHGTTEEIPLNRISEADLTYISEQWGLPRECRVRQENYTPRNWAPSQVAWKASGLCHKPLYFEEVNLERYGHTAGPVAQPVLSTAHFFVNIAVLPYKMGIHPPNECQYTLGYYRPGSCAPWVVPPVPISLRGAIAQTAAVGGLVGLIP